MRYVKVTQAFSHYGTITAQNYFLTVNPMYLPFSFVFQNSETEKILELIEHFSQLLPSCL